MTDSHIERQKAPSPEALEKNIVDQVRRLPDVDVPEGLSNRIMRAIYPRREPWWRTFLFRLSRPRTVSFTPLKWAPVGALVVVLMIGFGLNRIPKWSEPSLSRELARMPGDAEVHYLLGRQLLAGEQSEKALVHLKRAADVHPDRSLYHFWVGVNYWTLKDYNQELTRYQTVLQLDPDFLPAHVYIGHNYLDRGDWQMALRHYRRILEDVPNHPEALFNTGIALQHQGDPARENEAWKAYLDFFDRGQQAIQAVEYLNANDDFSFRRIQLGPLEIVKRSITFNPGQTFLDETAQATLDAIGRVVARNRKLQLHVVAYADNDAKAAKFRAIGIKRHLTEHFADISPQRIKPSWFGVSEKVQIEDGTHQLESSIRLFATIIDES